MQRRAPIVNTLTSIFKEIHIVCFRSIVLENIASPYNGTFLFDFNYFVISNEAGANRRDCNLNIGLSWRQNMNKGGIVEESMCEIKSRPRPIRIQKREFARDPPLGVCISAAQRYYTGLYQSFV